MSGGGSGQGAVYSPLPQSISDTESSEEELNSVLHANNHANTRKFVTIATDCVEQHNGYKMGDYRPLGHDVEADVSINGLPSGSLTADDVPIIKPDDSSPNLFEPMSPTRKFFFVLSIVLCWITVIVFLWVLPCSEGTCPSLSHEWGTKSWERALNKLELKGRISVVPGVPGRGRNLVFLLRGNVVNPSSDSENSSQDMEESIPQAGGGIISLVGATGEVAWWKPLFGLPHDIDCSLLDLNSNGVDDCIVVGSKGLLTSVDPISGFVMWYLHNHNDNKIKEHPTNLDFPLVLPDLDNDGVNELLTPCSLFNQRNYLLLVSGKIGAIMGQPLQLTECSSVHNLSVESDWNISYMCKQSTTNETIRNISLHELFDKTTNLLFTNIKNLNISRHVKQHEAIKMAFPNAGFDKNPSYTVNGRRLIFENEGHCPTSCMVVANVTDERSPLGNTLLWNFTAKNTYAMIPAILMFDNITSPANSGTTSNTISGFVLKFWQWSTKPKPFILSSSENNFKLNDRNESVTGHYKKKNTSNSFNVGEEDNVSLKSTHKTQRSVLPPSKQSPEASNSTHIVFHHLNERVVLITFNATDIHVIDASPSEITQMCSHHGISREELACQPDLSFQEQSLLIADLDEDGSQELISYLTTYSKKWPDGPTTSLESDSWVLQSKVKVTRLEAEPPKLYGAITKIP